MKISVSNGSRRLLLLGAGYCVLLFVLGSLRPLWMDEVLQLVVTAHPVDHSFFDQVRYNAGATPLGYLLGAASERIFGVTWLGSRLPSLLAGVAVGAALFSVAVEAGVEMPFLAAALLAICPLQLRYATEGRPYELALLFSILSSLIAIRLNRTASLKNAALYCFVLAVGIYFQPFVIFVGIGQAVWIALEGSKTRSWKALGWFAVACGAALALFLPWYLFAPPVSPSERTASSPRLALVLIREISGDGFLCSIPLMLAALVGFRKTPLAVTIPTCAALLGPFAADAAFGYFFAIRQSLFALPGLAVAASIGLVEIKRRSTTAAALVVLIFCGGAVGKAITYFGDPTENWPVAAAYIDARDDCVSFIPEYAVNFYAVFAPKLRHRVCSDASPASRAIVLVPHAPDPLLKQFQRESAGLPVVSVGGTLIATR